MVTIEIPKEVHQNIERRLDHAEFDTVEEYATFILVSVLEELEETPEDQELEDRLRSLGYL